MEKVIKILSLIVLFSGLLYLDIVSVLLVATGAKVLEIDTYEMVMFSGITFIAFLFPLSRVLKVTWKEIWGIYGDKSSKKVDKR